MNSQLHGLANNAQHRVDQATGAWTASGTGSKRIHQSYSGWTLRKQPNTNRWTIHTPDGELLHVHGVGFDQSVYNLTHAKFLADEAGAQNI